MTQRLSQSDLARILQQPDYELVGADIQRPAVKPLPGAPVPTEHDEQVALFAELERHADRYPDLRLAFAIPNGGHRYQAVAAKLKAEGVKPGVPDIFLPVARHGYHGLWIELKRSDGSNHATPEQEAMMARLTDQGYWCQVCYGAEEALGVILQYVGGGE